MVKCGYCGRENPDEAQACSGCGTPLAESPQQPIANQVTPASGAGGVVESALGAVGLLAGHPSGILHVLNGATRLDGDNGQDPDSPQVMLERAAILESVNMQAAVLLYQQILLKHPKSSAAKEARRNIQTLRVAHPELQL